MKKIIFSLLSLVSLCFGSTVFGDFSSSSLISGDMVFDKPHGISAPLYTHEDYYVNPFAGRAIQQVTNKVVTNGVTTSSSTSYAVDAVTFTTTHPLYKSTDSVLSGWTPQSPGVTSKIIYLENTYTTDVNGRLMPDQNVKVRKYYTVSYSHDTTTPTCGDLKLYNDASLSAPFSYNGGWINTDKYYTMVCADPESECKCDPTDTNCQLDQGKVIARPSVLGHRSQPTTSFINTVGLRNFSCTGVLPGGKLLMYDKASTKINLVFSGVDQGFDLASNRTYEELNGKKYDGTEISGRVRYAINDILKTKPGTSKFSLNIEDGYIASSMHGVSGLKNFSLNVYRKSLPHTNAAFSNTTYYSTGQTYLEYNPDGTKTVSDVKNITLTDLSLWESGDYKFVLFSYDWAGNETKATFYYTVYPGEPDNSRTIVQSSSNGDKYANNSLFYTYTLSLKDKYGNPVYGKQISSINQEGGSKTIKTDMTNPSLPTGADAIAEEWVGGNQVTNNSGQVSFTLKSLSPGVFSDSFKIILPQWGDDYTDLTISQSPIISKSTENSFLKPFVGDLSITSSPYKLLLGTALTMQLGVTQKTTISSYAIEQFKSQVTPADTMNHKILDVSDALSLSYNPTLDYRIEAKTNAGVQMIPEIFIKDNPIITYSLGGQTIRYRLSGTDSASDNGELTLGGDRISGLKIVGTLQGQGKQSIIGQQSNFSDISKSDMRSVIRRNAQILIRGMTTGQTANGVKYMEGNMEISGEPTYETLVVKNGNVTITDNFNTSGKKFGIIVLRDDAQRMDIGNIYIRPGVRYIQSVMYADGGLISTGFRAGEDTAVNYRDSTIRTSSLQKQLVIKGSVFTRNTIGGAILGDSGKYLLPGGATTTDFHLALIYDLNYLRRGNDGYDIPSGTKNYNLGNTENCIMISDTNALSNPPKGFENQQ